MELEEMTAFFTSRLDLYDEHMLREVPGCRAGYARMAALLPEGTARLLDLGCGTGALTAQVLEQDPRRQVTGLDLSEQMLAQARARLGDRVKLIQGDSEYLPFPDGSFDVVYCCDSFHHYPDPAAVLAEVGRVLVPGGVFLLGDIWLPLPGRLLMNPFLRWSREGDVKIYSRREILNLLGQVFHQATWRRAGGRAFVARGVR